MGRRDHRGAAGPRGGGRPWLAPLAAALVLSGCSLADDYDGAMCSAYAPCPTGYVCEGSPSLCSRIQASCAVAHGGCDVNASCADTARGRVCLCSPGFVGDGLTCARDPRVLEALSVRFDGEAAVPLSTLRLRHLLHPPVGTAAMTVAAVAGSHGAVTLAANGQALASGAAFTAPVVFQAGLVMLVVTDASGASLTYRVEAAPPP